MKKQKDVKDKIDWKLVAFELFQFSEGTFSRSVSRCRERWTNHLDTQITKKGWSIEEDLLLMNRVYEGDRKWSEISKMFNGVRT